MKNVILIVSCAILLGACSTIGTNANEVEPGVYQITAHGNIYHTKEVMLKRALAKAENKCGHSDFKNLGNPKLGENKVYLTTINGYSTSPNVTIKVDCKKK